MLCFKILEMFSILQNRSDLQTLEKYEISAYWFENLENYSRGEIPASEQRLYGESCYVIATKISTMASSVKAGLHHRLLKFWVEFKIKPVQKLKLCKSWHWGRSAKPNNTTLEIFLKDYRHAKLFL